MLLSRMISGRLGGVSLRRARRPHSGWQRIAEIRGSGMVSKLRVNPVPRLKTRNRLSAKVATGGNWLDGMLALVVKPRLVPQHVSLGCPALLAGRRPGEA